jgi:DNA-binding phage protein
MSQMKIKGGVRIDYDKLTQHLLPPVLEQSKNMFPNQETFQKAIEETAALNAQVSKQNEVLQNVVQVAQENNRILGEQVTVHREHVLALQATTEVATNATKVAEDQLNKYNMAIDASFQDHEDRIKTLEAVVKALEARLKALEPAVTESEVYTNPEAAI